MKRLIKNYKKQLIYGCLKIVFKLHFIFYSFIHFFLLVSQSIIQGLTGFHKTIFFNLFKFRIKERFVQYMILLLFIEKKNYTKKCSQALDTKIESKNSNYISLKWKKKLFI